ncbi:MAG: extracellular solute-binding protein [Clostridiales bacterium]|nr:extracellular solute-binding protein [Clostridiales bacterium]
MKNWKSVVAFLMAVLICLGGMGLAVAEEKKYDLGGRVVTLGHYNDLTPNENSPTYVEQMELIESIEEKYNCTIEFISTGDWHAWDATIKTMAMSGEKVADAFAHTIDYIIPTWSYAELLAPLDEYFDMADPMWNQLIMDTWSMNGKHYTVSTNKHGYLGTCILFNKRICAENGITDEYLYELQRNHEWTWDKLLELARKCTRDKNNDGQMDTWGFGAYGPSPIITESFVYANNATCVRMRDDMTYEYSLNDPAAIEAIEFCRQLVNENGVVYTGSWDWGTWEKLWNRGKVAFYQSFSWEVGNYVFNLEDDEFGVLLIPMGPQADGYVNAENVPDGWFIQECVEDKEAIAAILYDYLYPYDWKDEVEPYMSFENIVFDDESLEAFDLIDVPTFALGEAATWYRNNILWGDFGVNSNVSGRVFAETNASPAQAAFDEMTVSFKDQLEEME